MREILFRGKRKDNGKWVEGTFLHLNVGRDFICDGTVWIGTLQPCKYEVVTETVSQFTGLTDKNGKKIFEGDIIQGLGNVYECRWDEGNVEFIVFNGTESFGLAYADYPCMEVIGNIHDNPELLEANGGNL